MNLRTSLLWSSIVALVLIVSACGSTIEQSSSLSVEAEAMGPFFAGPNSLIADYSVDYASLYPDQTVNAEQIKKVTLSGVTVQLSGDSLDFSGFVSASVQFVSDQSEMVSAAILNPIEGGGQEITLQTSAEADLAPFFQGEAFTVVLDLDFIEDDYRDDIQAQVNMTFNTSLKQ